MRLKASIRQAGYLKLPTAGLLPAGFLSTCAAACAGSLTKTGNTIAKLQRHFCVDCIEHRAAWVVERSDCYQNAGDATPVSSPLTHSHCWPRWGNECLQVFLGQLGLAIADSIDQDVLHAQKYQCFRRASEVGLGVGRDVVRARSKLPPGTSCR